MIDDTQYLEIYSSGYKHLMYYKADGRYSFLERNFYSPDKFEYTEVIVAADKLEEALDIPSSYETSEFSKMKMLFGNLEGLKHFQDFCDNEGIETKTLFWEE